MLTRNRKQLHSYRAARLLAALSLCVSTIDVFGQPTFTDVTFGNSKFVGVSSALSILVSSDGTNWTRRSDGIKDVTFSLNYRQEKYAGGGAQITLAYPEVQPIHLHGEESKLTELRAVAYGGGTFVAVGQHGAIVTSRDTVSWNFQSIGQPNDFRGVAWGGSSFVVVGKNGELLSSPDGSTWTRRKTGIQNSLNAVTYGNGRYVAVGLHHPERSFD